MHDPSTAKLISGLTEGESGLARRCRSEPGFHQSIVHLTEALEMYYKEMGSGGSVLCSFLRKLRRWINNPPDSFIGFFGELRVAYWLSQHDVLHRFIDETRHSQSPDLALTILDRDVYFEVKTLQENPYQLFAERILEDIRRCLPDRGVGVKYLELGSCGMDALVEQALWLIYHKWLASPYSPIEYEGDEGAFSILLPKGGGVISSWPEQRVRKDGTPWLESQLETTMNDNIGQFEIDTPTFLVWISFDKALPSFVDQVIHVLERNGLRFHEVAGVIVQEPFTEWAVYPNRFHDRYEDLVDAGILDAIRDFPNR